MGCNSGGINAHRPKLGNPEYRIINAHPVKNKATRPFHDVPNKPMSQKSNLSFHRFHLTTNFF